MIKKSTIIIYEIVLIGIGILLGYFISTMQVNKTTYFHMALNNVDPPENAMPEDIFFEISRQGNPNDLMQKHLLEIMVLHVPPITGYGTRIIEIGSQAELKNLYQTSLDSRENVEYVVISNDEPEQILAFNSKKSTNGFLAPKRWLRWRGIAMRYARNIVSFMAAIRIRRIAIWANIY